MDQVKQALRVAIKYHFWILCVVVLLLGVLIWGAAADSLASRYLERANKLEGVRKEVNTVVKASSPPNQVVIDAIKQAHGKLKVDVLQAWNTLYQAQKKNYVWPDVLSPEFIKVVESLKPGATYLKMGEEIKYERYLAQYQNTIKRYLPNLGLILDIREPKAQREERIANLKAGRAPQEKLDSKGAPVNETPSLARGEMVGNVVWEGEKSVAQRFDWATLPTTTQILVAQEDLWIYEALLRIIAETNKDAATPFDATVKQITSLEFGRASGASTGGSVVARSPSQAPTELEVSTPASREAIASGILGGRYIDAQGKPLPYGANPPFIQFKMMSVRMNLVVDQRRLPKLLAQCANSAIPVEVKRVVLRPEAGTLPGGNKAGGNATGVSNGPQIAPGGAGSALEEARAAKLKALQEEASSWDMDVSLEGVLYIFNDPTAYNKPADAEGAGDEAAPAPAKAAAPAAAAKKMKFPGVPAP